MKTCKFLFAMLIMVLSTSCIIKPDYSSLVYILYTNDTQHHIAIENGVREYKYVEILPGESAYGSDVNANYSKGQDVNAHRDELFLHAIPSVITVIWDGEYSITCDIFKEAPSYLTDSSIYNYIGVKGTRVWVYGYTFTEADYEFAKENGVRINADVE